MVNLVPVNVRSARTLAAAERRARIVQLRRERLTFAEIAVEMGMTPSGVWRAYEKALASVPSPAVAQHRQEEVQLTDDVVRDLLRIARNPANLLRYRVEAYSVARSWSERKDRLLGLNAPTKRSVEIIEQDTVEREIRRLEQELLAMGATAEELGLVGRAKVAPVPREPGRDELGDGPGGL